MWYIYVNKNIYTENNGKYSKMGFKRTNNDLQIQRQDIKNKMLCFSSSFTVLWGNYGSLHLKSAQIMQIYDLY